MTSPAYNAANAAFEEAFESYSAASRAYRDGKMSDDDFLAERARYNEAQAAFDAAYEAEEGTPEEEAAVPETPSPQMEMF
jgi:hypothetical protein